MTSNENGSTTQELTRHGDGTPDMPRPTAHLERQRRVSSRSRTWDRPIHRYASTPGAAPLVRSAEITELGSELEGLEDVAVEFAAAFVSMWPKRLHNLREAVVAEDLSAIRDAVGSVRVSAMMIGADRLESAADHLLVEAETEGPAAARQPLAELVEVGEATVRAMRAEFFREESAGHGRHAAEEARAADGS